MVKRKKTLSKSNKDNENKQKFKIVLPKHCENIYLTIDENQHNLNKNQVCALTKGLINVFQKMPPEIDVLELI